MDVMETGAQAEQAKPYVEDLFQRAEGVILDNIIALNVDQTMEFTVYKSQLMCLKDLMATLEADITAGQRKVSEIQGDVGPDNQGIL